MLALLLMAILAPAPRTLGTEQPESSETEWTRTYGGAKDDRAYCVIQTGDDGYAIAGYTNSFGAGDYDFWLVKANSSGDMQWNKTFDGLVRDDFARAVVQTSDGGFAVAGESVRPRVGSAFWLVKTDSAGNEQWNKTYKEVVGYESAQSVVQTGDGGYALAGYTYRAGSYDFWLVKTDAAGDVQWSQTYGGANSDYAYSVVQTNDDGYAIAGQTSPSDTATHIDFWLVKADTEGNMEWNGTYGGVHDDYGRDVAQTDDGGYALAGRIDCSSDGRGWDCWLIKTDPEGNTQWDRTYGSLGSEYGESIVETADGGFALAGYYNSSSPGAKPDFWFLKTDQYGNVEYNGMYGGANEEQAYSLVQTSDEGYVLAGYTDTSGVGLCDFWVVKIGSVAPPVAGVYVDPQTQKAAYNKLFSVNVNVTDVVDLYGFELKLQYDPALIDAVSITLGSFLNPPTTILEEEINETMGFLLFSAFSIGLAPPASGNGVLATLVFNATPGGNCYLDFLEMNLINTGGALIGRQMFNGFFEYVQVQGDVNADCIVNVFDVFKMGKAFGAIPSQPNWDSNCDINNDDVVDDIDLAVERVDYGKLWDPAYVHELFYEIDYMPGHMPTESALAYIQDYYAERWVRITFYIDDEVPLDDSVTDAEFSEFNETYNDHNFGYYSQWKWVLFGTVVDGEPGTAGYVWGDDDKANYAFIADQTGDNFAIDHAGEGVTAEEVETAVLMHEMGHTIGILKLDSEGKEVYDGNAWSVMALLSLDNCNAEPIRYSREYWILRNLEYYDVHPPNVT
jgi:hypothetical protein